MPQAMAQTCPQCGADIRLSGVRCKTCGFWLPATPARRTGPPTARPPEPSRERRVVWLLAAGAALALGLFGAGAALWLRHPAAPSALPAATAAAATASSVAPRIEPSQLLAEARREASAWRRDAVLVTLSAGPLDAQGVAPGGKLQLSYAEPAGARITGGAETRAEQLHLESSGGKLVQSEARAGKGQVAPEPHCVLEDAWSAAQRAGTSPEAALSLRYAWSDKHGRPLWEVVTADGQVKRRLDGVTCSILTR